MKLMIASDIHGSAKYCRMLKDAFERECPDKLLLLGDLLYHGPRNDLPEEYDPKQTMEILNSLKDWIICVRGNCEAEVDQAVLDFPVLAEYCMLFVDGKTLLASHGHKIDEDDLPKLSEGDILLSGHTHIPACRTHDNGILYVNPGSVSIPKKNSEHQYLIFENLVFTWKEMSGTVLKEYNADHYE